MLDANAQWQACELKSEPDCCTLGMQTAAIEDALKTELEQPTNQRRQLRRRRSRRQLPNPGRCGRCATASAHSVWQPTSLQSQDDFAGGYDARQGSELAHEKSSAGCRQTICCSAIPGAGRSRTSVI